MAERMQGNVVQRQRSQARFPGRVPGHSPLPRVILQHAPAGLPPPPARHMSAAELARQAPVRKFTVIGKVYVFPDHTRAVSARVHYPRRWLHANDPLVAQGAFEVHAGAGLNLEDVQHFPHLPNRA